MADPFLARIIIPVNSGETPALCSEHKQPIVQGGSYVSFVVTDIEHKFWKSLSNEERTTLRNEAMKRCFYDVLHEEIDGRKKLRERSEE